MPISLKHLQATHGGALSAHHKGENRRQTFLMTTGIECSYPTVQGGRRRDELESTGHYKHWRDDFEICREIGARYLRYGLPYYRMHLGPGRYDWSWSDEVLPALWDAGVVPIVDLCHFGVPDWVGSFQNTDWPPLFADYAAAFAERYPWIKLYTPVNEMLLCARMSAKMGWWNEQETTDRAFVTAHTVECRATLLAIAKILERRPDAVFIQSEIAEVFLERWPQTHDEVRLKNHHRFITFDILFGRETDADVAAYLHDNGCSRDQYAWFMREGQKAAPHCVMGMDYYSNNEKTIHRDGSEAAEGAMIGWALIALNYFQRYRRPMMLTETNTVDRGAGEAIHWLRQTWYQVNYLRNQGLPVIGYTWYSLTDQIDWDIQLREIRGKVNENGLYSLDRTPHAVAQTFREFAHTYGREPLLRTIPVGFEGKL